MMQSQRPNDSGQGGNEPPVGIVEQTIASVWHDLLGGEQFSRHDDFFDHGGDSLLGLQSMRTLGAAFRMNLSLQHLFAASTVAALADIVIQELIGQTDEGTLSQLLSEVAAAEAPPSPQLGP
jgi:hypothetical protein